MTDSPGPSGRRRRFWPRFRVRTLLVVTALACVPMTWFGLELQQARRSQRLVDRLRAEKRLPRITFKAREIFGISTDAIPLWNEVADGLDAPFLRQRVEDMEIPSVTDEDLAELAELLPCERLTSVRSRITDAGVVHFARMPHLRRLWMGLHVSADGLAKLADVATLEELILLNSVTDDTLTRVAELKQVRMFELAATPVTEVGLRYVAKMPSLRYLEIHGRVTDTDIDVIAGMHFLEGLNLAAAGVTDEHVAKLARLTNLKELVLHNNPITPAGLVPLEALERFELLDVRESQANRARTQPTFEWLKRIKTVMY